MVIENFNYFGVENGVHPDAGCIALSLSAVMGLNFSGLVLAAAKNKELLKLLAEKYHFIVCKYKLMFVHINKLYEWSRCCEASLSSLMHQLKLI